MLGGAVKQSTETLLGFASTIFVQLRMVMQPAQAQPMLDRYLNRRSRLYRLLRPPLPLISSPNEVFLPECSGVKLFLGGAGSNAPASFLNIDLFATSV